MGLDPHSVYMNKRRLQRIAGRHLGEFSGLGLEVGIQDGYITIISPIDGSPAAAANLQSGDVISNWTMPRSGHDTERGHRTDARPQRAARSS